MKSVIMIILRYCLSATWFRDWEAWVCNKAREPPG